MILVFGSYEYDQGTGPVLDWLSYYGADFLKITYQDFYGEHAGHWNFDLSSDTAFFEGIDLKSKINVIWNRRLELYDSSWSIGFKEVQSPLFHQLETELKREKKYVFEYLFALLADKKWLPKSGIKDMNKLNVLRKAVAIGLSVPATRLTNSKNDIISFLRKNSEGIITKPISDSFYYNVSDSLTYLAYTAGVEEAHVDTLETTFPISLFQQRIEVELELRVFYLDSVFFTQAAIFPGEEENVIDIKQKRETTHINYVPFQLPDEIRSKLDQLMVSLDIKMGSIDLLLTKSGDYIFLEVNPGGQYLFESQNCNFNIEQKIAEWLIKNDRT